MHSSQLFSILAFSSSLSVSALFVEPRQDTVGQGSPATAASGSYGSATASSAYYGSAYGTQTSGSSYASSTADSGPTAEDEYIASVCAPTNSTGDPDLAFPCNIFEVLLYDCIYSGNASSNGSVPEDSPAAQQKCLCGDSGAAVWKNLDAYEIHLHLQRRLAISRY